jgi:signal transduction histidine kinase
MVNARTEAKVRQDTVFAYVGISLVFVMIIILLWIARVELNTRKVSEKQREELVKKLEFKNRELQDIVYAASHDLKSPLVNIQGFSGALKSNCDHLLQTLKDGKANDIREEVEAVIGEEMPQSLDFIMSGTKKIYNLLNGLLQISRIGETEIKNEVIDVNALLDDILKSVEYQIKENDIHITVDCLPACTGDKGMLDSVFSNLIGNAIKYSNLSANKEIHITGQIKERISIYCIEDNGIGIAPEHQKKIFEIFHRLDPDDDAGGEGLGLTIVVRILERLNGKIWLESEPGKGSSFFVALPTK